MQIDLRIWILWILSTFAFDIYHQSKSITSPCHYPVPTASFLMRQQCSAYFNLDILCDIDGMISGVTAERLQVAYENNACFKSGQVGIGIMVVKHLSVPDVRDVERDEEWSCLDVSKKILLQRYLPWKNNTALYNYMDLFTETIMNRWFVKNRECKKPYFLFLIAAKDESPSIVDPSFKDIIPYPMIRIVADPVFAKDFGSAFVTYLKEYIFYNDMSTPGRTLPIIMDKICRKFDETDENLRLRQSVPDWAIALFVVCSLASVLCLLIDVLLIRKNAFRSLATKSDGQRGRPADGGQKRSENVQVHLLF